MKNFIRLSARLVFEQPEFLDKVMCLEYRKLGYSGLTVSRLCFGALTIGPLQADFPLHKGAGVIRRALEDGVNFIDTAELYGTYPYIREALRGWPGETIIASKSYAYTREGMVKSLEQARRDLDRDVIEIFLLHEQESHLTLKGHWEAYEYLLEAKEKGIIKAAGISTHAVAGVKAAAATAEIDVIHPLINIAGVGIMDGTRDEMLTAVKEAHAAGKGIYGMKPIGGGNLLARVDESLQYVLALDCLDAIALGMKSPAEVEMNVSIFNGQAVSRELRSAVSAEPRRLHIEGWCSGCGNCIQRCRQGALYLSQERVSVRQEKCVLCGYCGPVCKEFCIKVI